MKVPENPRSGILLVDKPQGITSHDVVARTRKFVGTRKVGHAGTLDPMATGLLVLGVNSATRLLTWIVGLDKEYTATIRLGAASSTDDAEGELGERADAAALATATDTAIAAEVARLTGPISQRPSSVSAIKVHGKRAYTLAREGQEVVLAERAVTISVFDVLATRRGEWIDLDVLVECSSGTYIRALARDLGQALGVGGHLTALRRTRIGPFAVTDATALDEGAAAGLVAPAVVATRLFPAIDLSEELAVDLANGKRIAVAGAASGPLAAIAPDGRLVGLIEVTGGPSTGARELSRGCGARMIPWFELAQVAVAVIAGLLCLVLGFAGRLPNDLTIGAALLVELLLIAQVVVALFSRAFGNLPRAAAWSSGCTWFGGPDPAAAAFWALVERTRWSTVILGVACLAVAVMVYRMGTDLVVQ